MIDDTRNDFDKEASFFDDMHPERDAEFAYYRERISRPGVSVLDLACGTGAVTSHLADAGATVVGLDSSAKMIAVAKERVPNATFVVGDMRDFNLGQRFDLVICAFNSLQHMLTGQAFRAALKQVKRHLAPDGVFCFDIFNPAPEFLVTKRQNEFVRRVFSTAVNATCDLYEDTAYDPEAKILYLDWRLIGPEGRIVHQNRFSMRQVFPDELSAWLGAEGLSVKAKYGDFSYGAFSEASHHQVITAGHS